MFNLSVIIRDRHGLIVTSWPNLSPHECDVVISAIKRTHEGKELEFTMLPAKARSAYHKSI